MPHRLLLHVDLDEFIAAVERPATSRARGSADRRRRRRRSDEARRGLDRLVRGTRGRKTAAKLDALGIRTVAELAAADDAALAARFGPRTGPWLASLGRGEGSTRVHTEGWVPKGISREHTFQQNLTDPAEIARELERIARDVAGDVANRRVSLGA